MKRSQIALLALVALGSTVAFAGAAMGSAAPVGRPWMNKALTPDQRARALVASMTLDGIHRRSIEQGHAYRRYNVLAEYAAGRPWQVHGLRSEWTRPGPE